MSQLKLESLNGQKIKFLALAGPIFIPGFGNLKSPIMSKGDIIQRGVPMEILDGMVLLTVDPKKKPVLIPLSYCSHIMLEE